MAVSNVSHLLTVCRQVIAYANIVQPYVHPLQFANAPFYETSAGGIYSKIAMFFSFSQKTIHNY
jgi:hypothetical protein